MTAAWFRPPSDFERARKAAAKTAAHPAAMAVSQSCLAMKQMALKGPHSQAVQTMFPQGEERLDSSPHLPASSKGVPENQPSSYPMPICCLIIAIICGVICGFPMPPGGSPMPCDGIICGVGGGLIPGAIIPPADGRGGGGGEGGV